MSLTATPDVAPRSPSWMLLQQTYETYRQHFWGWLTLTLPAALLATFVLLVFDWRIKAFFQSIPRDPYYYLSHKWDLLGISALRFVGFFIAWLLGWFTLAAVASVVGKQVRGEKDLAWEGDGYGMARERLPALLAVAAITFFALVAAYAFLLAPGAALLAALHFTGRRASYVLGCAETLLIGAVLSWFGMAASAVIWETASGWQALKRSWRLSDGCEAYLALLVAESLFGGVLAGYVVYYVVGTFAYRIPIPPFWTSWLLFALAVLVGAALQPPMFIGFALLYENQTETSGEEKTEGTCPPDPPPVGPRFGLP